MEAEGAPVIPSLCQNFVLRVLKAKATDQRKVEIDVGVAGNRIGDLEHERQQGYQLCYMSAPIIQTSRV